MDDEDNAAHQSADDALQPADDLFNPQRDEEQLEQDYDSPAAPPSDVRSASPPDYPQTDTSVDAHEAYDVGLTSATGVNDQEEETSRNVRPLEPEDETGSGTEHRAG